MSRLIVKNLPSYISDERIKEHFSSQGGTITDVKLVHRPDGTSRRFAFVGFKTDNDAAKARTYFDRSYIDTSRISVLVVDPSKGTERPLKRQKLDASSAAIDRTQKSAPLNVKGDKSASGSVSKPSKDDSTLAEFMEVMKPRTKKDRSWANDPDPSTSTLLPEASTSSAVPKQDTNAPSATKLAKKNIKGKERMADGDQELPTESADNGEAISDLEWMRRRIASSALDSNAAPPESMVVDQDENETTIDTKPPADDADTGPSEDSVAELLKESPGFISET